MFLRGVELSEGATALRLRRGLEDRVVAEAADSERAGRDPAASRSPPGQDLEAPPATGHRSRERECQDADVAGAAPCRGQAFEGAEELRVVLRIGRGFACVPPRPDAGSAIERVDLEPRVVGEGRQAGGAGGEAGLDPGVRLEREAVLDRVARDRELVERYEIKVGEAFECQELPELAQLVRRACRDDEPAAAPRRRGQRRTVASAAAWASNRRVKPVWARSRRASTRARSKGLPSAVPWSST